MKFLITGGTGSVGYAICKELLSSGIASEIFIYSRNIKEQMAMKAFFQNKKINFIVGDINDFNSIFLATRGIDYVIHTAANKHIDIAAEFPFETTMINVIGTNNVVNACIQNSVKGMILTSSDKACSPTSLYGTTKLLAEKNVTLANSFSDTKFSTLRYGNVIGSNGSIFQKWKNLILSKEKIQITHKDMTRFFISETDAAKFCVSSLMNASGGELFLPKMKSALIYDIAMSIATEKDIEFIGLRKTEKMHEDLLCKQDIGTVKEFDSQYVLYPTSETHDLCINSKNNRDKFTQEEISLFFNL